MFSNTVLLIVLYVVFIVVLICSDERSQWRGALIVETCCLALSDSSVQFFIRYDTRCYFDVRSKADMSRLNLQHGNDN